MFAGDALAVAAHDSVGAAFFGASGPATPAIPNTTAGTFCIAFYSTRSSNNTFTINSADGSWTEVLEVAQSGLSIGAAYRRMAGSDSDPSIAVDTPTGGGVYAFVSCATGIVTSGDPLDVAIDTTLGSSGTTQTSPGVTLANAGALVYSIHYGRNDTGGAGGWSNCARSGGSPSDSAGGNSYETMIGSDGGFGLCAEVIGSTGATGTVSMDVAVDVTADHATIALTPAAAGGGSNPPQGLQLLHRGFGPHPAGRLGGILQ